MKKGVMWQRWIFWPKKNLYKIWPKNGLKLPKIAKNRVLSLKVGGKSKKLAGIISPDPSFFFMYAQNDCN